MKLPYLILMRKTVAWLCSCAFILLACEDDHNALGFPTIVTSGIEVTESGARFNGEILEAGLGSIDEKGFVWSLGESPVVEDNRIILEQNVRGKFTAEIRSGLANGLTYYVRAYAKSGATTIYGNIVSFKAEGSAAPTISDFSPKYGPIGTTVTITGTNLGYGGKELTLMIGDETIPVKTVSDTQITFEVPDVTKPSKGPITVKVGNMVASSAEQFDIYFPWAVKSNIAISSKTAYFTDDQYIYFIEPQSTIMKVLDPSTMEFLPSIVLPTFSGQSETATSKNGVAYITLRNKLYSFNIEQATWTLISDNTIGFNYMYVIGNDLYAGTLSNGTQSSLNLDTRVWTSKSGLSVNLFAPDYYPNASVIHDKAYVNVGPELWSYDPVANVWSSHGDVGGIGSRVCSFSIGDNFFLGLGDSFAPDFYYKETELFSYDVVTGSKTQYHSCPYRMSVAASIAVNNKAYIFSFYVSSFSDGRDLVFEFDPAKN
jgi:hypothetical protein